MTPAPSVDVVVPIHGGRALTQQCLATLAEQTCVHRTIVVDNASPDDSVAALRTAFPRVELLELGANRGYASACNAGIAAGEADVVVLLNNDVLLPADFLERLVAPLAADAALGSATPLLLRPDRTTIDNAGLTADATLAGFPRHQGRLAGTATEARPSLLGPSGAAGAYRREALAAVEGLDEAIFLYQEDLDLALRLRAAGWPTTLAPDAVGVHLGSATSLRRSAAQRRHSGFARGYLLRRYGVLRGRHAARALATELVVAAGDLLISRDAAALRGRLAGWSAAAGAPRRRPPRDALEASIGLRASLRLRRADYAVAASS
ncbi:MAG TPA: glycosyltransferase family 2 protein [Conexibacter sp.]|nr:glycosyltransferase family 2 protein [Conexibacter sp.]